MEKKPICVKVIPVAFEASDELIRALKRQKRINRALTAFAIFTTACLVMQDNSIEKLKDKLRKLKQAERD